MAYTGNRHLTWEEAGQFGRLGDDVEEKRLMKAHVAVCKRCDTFVVGAASSKNAFARAENPFEAREGGGSGRPTGRAKTLDELDDTPGDDDDLNE